MNNITNEKIKRLTQKSKDKSLSRAERMQAVEELNWERYRADSRPSISLRKSKMLDAVVYLGDMIIFGYMGISENISPSILNHKGFNAADLAMLLIIVVLIALVFAYIVIHNKYKIEPADELANRNMEKAQKTATIWIIIAGLIFAGAYSMMSEPDGYLKIKNSSLLGLFCMIEFGFCFLSNIIFVFLEGRETEEALEDE